MGEEKKDKAASKQADKKTKNAAAPPQAAEQLQPIVLKVDLHCAGCASKVKRAIRHAPGVESVKTDTAANKVVVTGAAADAADLKERIEARAKKPVHIVSAGAGAGAGPAKKDDKENGKPEKKADGGDEKGKKPEKEKGDKPEKGEKGNKTEKKAEKKPKDNKEEKKPKEAKEETVTLKIRLHCDGCIDRIRRRVYKIKGVKDVAVDAGKDLVKVTGTMDAAALPGYLRDKLSRPVEVVKKDGGDKKADGEKSKKEGGGGGGDDKKDKSVAPMPMADPSMYQMPPQYHGYHVPYNATPGGYYGAAAAAPPPNPAFYPAAYYPPPPPPPYASYPAHAPQMFSDENPNACSVM